MLESKLSKNILSCLQALDASAGFLSVTPSVVKLIIKGDQNAIFEFKNNRLLAKRTPEGAYQVLAKGGKLSIKKLDALPNRLPQRPLANAESLGTLTPLLKVLDDSFVPSALGVTHDHVTAGDPTIVCMFDLPQRRRQLSSSIPTRWVRLAKTLAVSSFALASDDGLVQLEIKGDDVQGSVWGLPPVTPLSIFEPRRMDEKGSVNSVLNDPEGGWVLSTRSWSSKTLTQGQYDVLSRFGKSGWSMAAEEHSVQLSRPGVQVVLAALKNA
jgi:hypothetical protein